MKYTIVQGIVNIRCSCKNDYNFISSDVNNLQKYHATNILFQLQVSSVNFYKLKEASGYILDILFSIFKLSPNRHLKRSFLALE